MKLRTLCTLSLPVVFAISAWAGPCSDPTTWCEKNSGDAGQFLPDADITIGGPVLTDIIGTLGDGTNGADLYLIQITNPAVFSATTEDTPSNNPDLNPALYLLDSTGHAIYGIDDNSASDTQATLAAGLGIGPQTAGLYYLLIAPSGNLPERGNGNPLFTLVTGSDVGGNAGTLQHYSKNGCGDGCAGKYDIELTGAGFAETPEPQSVALLSAGLLMLGMLRRKRSRG